MIIFRYLLKEVAKTQFAVFIVLMAIFISNKFVRILDDASEGGIPGHLVMIFIGLKIPDLAGMILPLSLFLGILLAYGRIYADNEMSVLHACGISEWYVVRVTLILSFITAIITGVFTLYLSPLASEYEYQVKDELAADSGLSALTPGRFQKTGNEKAVVFIHNKGAENTLNKVFVAQLPDEDHLNESIINASLVYAEQGQVIEEESGSQRLILSEGTRYQSDAKNNEFREVAFSKYYIQIEDKKVEHKRRKLSAMPTQGLIDETNNKEYSAEIQWRMAFPLVCLVVTFIAVPLSVVNPRQGKFGKMLPALILFLSYFLLLTASRSAIESGAIPSYIGLWPIHLFAFVLGTILLLKSRSTGLFVKSFLPSFSRKKASN